jgi:hypothetical protein
MQDARECVQEEQVQQQHAKKDHLLDSLRLGFATDFPHVRRSMLPKALITVQKVV